MGTIHFAGTEDKFLCLADPREDISYSTLWLSLCCWDVSMLLKILSINIVETKLIDINTGYKGFQNTKAPSCGKWMMTPWKIKQGSRFWKLDLQEVTELLWWKWICSVIFYEYNMLTLGPELGEFNKSTLGENRKKMFDRRVSQEQMS